MMDGIWRNPPGIFYAGSYVLAALFFVFFVQRKRVSLRAALGKGVLALALLALMIVFDDVPQKVFLFYMLCYLLLLYGVVSLGSTMDREHRIYYTFHIFLVGEFCASLEWQLCYFVFSGNQFNRVPLEKLIWLGVLYVLLFVVVFAVMYRMYHRKPEPEITLRQAVSVGVLVLAVFAISNLSYLSVDTPFTAQLPREIFNIHTWVDLGGIAILFAYHIQLCEVQMKVDFDNMQNILEMQYANYQISQQSVDMVNQKYHDLKHQIAILREEFGSKEALPYLDRMEKEIASYEAQNKTGNKILDTILTGKSLYCQQNDMKLTCVADGHLIDFMDIMDISSLFGNALDNAIESVQAIPEKEKRLIHLTVSREKGFVRIRLENCYGGSLDFRNGLPETTKKDRNYHGYGLKSIKSIAHKYNGSVTIQAKDGWFELRILIPRRDFS